MLRTTRTSCDSDFIEKAIDHLTRWLFIYLQALNNGTAHLFPLKGSKFSVLNAWFRGEAVNFWTNQDPKFYPIDDEMLGYNFEVACTSPNFLIKADMLCNNPRLTALMPTLPFVIQMRQQYKLAMQQSVRTPWHAFTPTGEASPLIDDSLYNNGVDYFPESSSYVALAESLVSSPKTVSHQSPASSPFAGPSPCTDSIECRREFGDSLRLNITLFSSQTQIPSHQNGTLVSPQPSPDSSSEMSLDY